jgi:hypothetical protein
MPATRAFGSDFEKLVTAFAAAFSLADRGKRSDPLAD